MTQYQLVFLVKTGLKKSDGEVVFEALRTAIVKAGGKIDKEEFWGGKKLVYMIKRQKEADYFFWKLKCKDIFKIAGLNLFLNREPNIIRYLLVKE